MSKFFTASLCAVVASVLLAAASFAQGPLGMSYPEKVRMLEQALTLDPSNTNTLVQLGNTYYDWGFQEINTKGNDAQPGYYWLKAIDYYAAALERIPNDPNIRTDRANLLWYTGNIDEAIEEYRKAKEADPKHSQSRLNLVKILGEEKGDYKAAVKEYDDMIKALPNMGYDMELKQAVDNYRSLAEGKSPDTGLKPSGQAPAGQQEENQYEFKW